MINPHFNLPDGCTMDQINGPEPKKEDRFRGTESAVFAEAEEAECPNPYCFARLRNPARWFVCDGFEAEEDHCRECKGMFAAQRLPEGGIRFTFSGEFRDEI